MLFLVRILSEAALIAGLPVLSSETHGMAQRGGTVISHVKIGPFHSPLIRIGTADLLLVLHPENLELHRHFLRPGGQILVNTKENNGAYHTIDATGLATEIGAPVTANLVLLGYALAKGLLFCREEHIRRSLPRLSNGSRLAVNLKSLELGLNWKAGDKPTSR